MITFSISALSLPLTDDGVGDLGTLVAGWGGGGGGWRRPSYGDGVLDEVRGLKELLDCQAAGALEGDAGQRPGGTHLTLAHVSQEGHVVVPLSPWGEIKGDYTLFISTWLINSTPFLLYYWLVLMQATPQLHYSANGWWILGEAESYWRLQGSDRLGLPAKIT